jgi:hypothetical protein
MAKTITRDQATVRFSSVILISLNPSYLLLILFTQFQQLVLSKDWWMTCKQRRRQWSRDTSFTWRDCRKISRSGYNDIRITDLPNTSMMQIPNTRYVFPCTLASPRGGGGSEIATSNICVDNADQSAQCSNLDGSAAISRLHEEWHKK